MILGNGRIKIKWKRYSQLHLRDPVVVEKLEAGAIEADHDSRTNPGDYSVRYYEQLGALEMGSHHFMQL